MGRHSKKLQMQGLQNRGPARRVGSPSEARTILRNEAYLQYAAMIHPVKSALPSRVARI